MFVSAFTPIGSRQPLVFHKRANHHAHGFDRIKVGQTLNCATSRARSLKAPLRFCGDPGELFPAQVVRNKTRHNALKHMVTYQAYRKSAPLFVFGEGFEAVEGLDMQQAPNARGSAEVAGSPQLIGMNGRLYLGI